MNRITKFKAERSRVLDQMQALLEATASEERDLNEGETKTYEALCAEDEQLAAQVTREEDFMKRMAAIARPADSLPKAAQSFDGSPRSVPAEARQPLEAGMNFARITQALASSNMDLRAAAHHAEGAWGSEAGQMLANLEQSTDSKGGFLVDEAHSRDFIDLLRPRVAVRHLGAALTPMPNGNLTMRKKTSGTSATYVGEREKIPLTGLEVGEMLLSAKKLTAMVPISNDLLRHTSLNVTKMVRDDLQEAIAVREDQQFIRGTGDTKTPTGLLHLAAAANKIKADATISLQNVDNDLGKLRLKLHTNNIPMTRPGYIISHRTREFLARLRDGNGNKAYPEIGEGRIGAWPFVATTSIPDNLGAGSNESEIYLADFAQVILADTYRLTIATSEHAAYHDGTTMRSAFQTDEMLIRIIEEHDLGTRYDTAIAVLQGVTWTP